MSDLIETRVSPDGKQICRIHEDVNAENPREVMDNLGTIAGFEMYKIEIGDHTYKEGEEKNAVVSLPMQHWDHGMVGWIYINQDKVDEKFPEGISKKKLSKLLESEGKHYRAWYEGAVYGYIIYEVEECNLGHKHETNIDHCFGYYDIDFLVDDAGVTAWKVTQTVR